MTQSRRVALSRALVATTVDLRRAAGAWSPLRPRSLRVCGDPENLPFSNQKLEGFENRIAAVIAADLGATPSYTWWPHQRGLVRNTIEAGTCDVIFGVPEGLDVVLWTKPYYRSSYVIAYRRDRDYRITSLDAPELKTLRIGVYENTPADESLARRGLLNNVSAYSLFFDPAGDRDRPVEAAGGPGCRHGWTWPSHGDHWPATTQRSSMRRSCWSLSREEPGCRFRSASPWV